MDARENYRCHCFLLQKKESCRCSLKPILGSLVIPCDTHKNGWLMMVGATCQVVLLWGSDISEMSAHPPSWPIPQKVNFAEDMTDYLPVNEHRPIIDPENSPCAVETSLSTPIWRDLCLSVKWDGKKMFESFSMKIDQRITHWVTGTKLQRFFCPPPSLMVCWYFRTFSGFMLEKR